MPVERAAKLLKKKNIATKGGREKERTNDLSRGEEEKLRKEGKERKERKKESSWFPGWIGSEISERRKVQRTFLLPPLPYSGLGCC